MKGKRIWDYCGVTGQCQSAIRVFLGAGVLSGYKGALQCMSISLLSHCCHEQADRSHIKDEGLILAQGLRWETAW